MSFILNLFRPSESKVLQEVTTLPPETDDIEKTRKKLTAYAERFPNNVQIQQAVKRAQTNLKVQECVHEIFLLCIEENIPKAQKRLAAYAGRYPGDARISEAIKNTQLALQMRRCFQNADFLDVNLTQPSFSSKEYETLRDRLLSLKQDLAEISCCLQEPDRNTLEERVQVYSARLAQLDPTAWKVHWVARSALALGVIWGCGLTWPVGLLGAGVAYGMEKGLSYLLSPAVPPMVPIVPLSPQSPAGLEMPQTIGRATLPPIGIPNEGNTCFIAAALQAEVFTDPVIEKALWNAWKEGRPIAEFGKLVHAYRTMQDGVPSDGIHVGELRNALERVSHNVSFLGGQHDSNEVMTHVIDALHDDILRVDPNYFCHQTVTKTWVVPAGLKLAPGESLVRRSQENENHGELEVPFQPGINLPQMVGLCLEGRDQLDEDSGLKIRIAGREPYVARECTYSTKWDRRPSQLSIELKRYRYDPKTQTRMKIKDKVAVPMQMRLGARFFGDQTKCQDYELGSFIQHDGESPETGHYIAYAKINGRYWRMSDSDCTEVTLEQFQEEAQSAYRFRYVPVGVPVTP